MSSAANMPNLAIATTSSPSHTVLSAENLPNDSSNAAGQPTIVASAAGLVNVAVGQSTCKTIDHV